MSKWFLCVGIAASAFGWTTPVNLGANVNTAAGENSPAVGNFAGGTYLVFHSNRGGGYGGGDLYQSRASGAPPYTWAPAVNMGPTLNTSAYEQDPDIYASTYPELYFVSNRPGTEIWMSTYQSGSWTAPVNVGPVINTGGARDPALVAGPTRMFFCSTRPGGCGGYDIWCSTYSGGWQTPVNVGSPVNTSDSELGVGVTADGLKMYFSRGLSNSDIYEATYSGGTWGNVRNLGPPVNTSYSEYSPCVSADGSWLYFHSDRPGGSGGYDIWVSRNNDAVVPASLGQVRALFR